MLLTQLETDVFTPQGIKPYEQIIIFIQKGNDLDTCAGALALAKIFKSKFPDKYCKIVGLNKLNNTLLKDIRNFAVSGRGEFVEDKNTLGILVDINGPSQIIPKDLLPLCTDFLIFDHHSFDEMDELFEDSFTHKIKSNHSHQEFSSTCEIIWTLIKRNGWKVTKELAEILFMGLYSDNQDFIAQTTNSLTFKIVAEMMDEGAEIKKLIRLFRRRDLAHIKIFADLIANRSQKEGNLLIMNLNPDIVYEVFPWNFFRNPDGKIRQKKLLTFPLVMAQQNIEANTYIFIHYSLFDPFSANKKYIFVVMNEPNSDLERILMHHDFKKHRNRWSRVWDFKEILELLEKYKEILIK